MFQVSSNGRSGCESVNGESKKGTPVGAGATKDKDRLKRFAEEFEEDPRSLLVTNSFVSDTVTHRRSYLLADKF